MTADKHAIRLALRGQRRDLPAATVAAAGRAAVALLPQVAVYRSAVSVLAYVASENEVPTAEVLADAARLGRQLYLPRISGAAGFMRWQPGQALQATRHGILEPTDGFVEHASSPAVILVPVVAWDACGTRLGRGGGFYDRVLADLDPAVVRIGLAYEFQEYPGCPRDVWDVPLHVVITEQRIVRCRGARDDLFQKGGLHL